MVGHYHKQKYDPNYYAKKHGLVKREEAPSTAKKIGQRIKQRVQEKVQRYQQRNTPPRRKERTQQYNLEASELQAKNKVRKAKFEGRKYSALNAFASGGMGNVTKARGSKRAHAPSISNNSMMGSGQGLNEMFGSGGSIVGSARKQKVPRARQTSGLNEMFGI